MGERRPARLLATGSPVFATTHWSVVLQARSGDSTKAAEALEELCRTYWFPLYVFARRQGHSAEDAEDLVQSFLARLIEKNYIKNIDRSKGRFRSFLLVAFKHFLSQEWEKARTQKRGGLVRFVSLQGETAESRYFEEPATDLTPEKLYEQHWALVLLDCVMRRLEKYFAEAGKGEFFEAAKGLLVGKHLPQTYAELAARFKLSEPALRMKVQRMRERYQQVLREEIADTVAGPEGVEDEIRYLFRILSN